MYYFRRSLNRDKASAEKYFKVVGNLSKKEVRALTLFARKATSSDLLNLDHIFPSLPKPTRKILTSLRQRLPDTGDDLNSLVRWMMKREASRTAIRSATLLRAAPGKGSKIARIKPVTDVGGKRARIIGAAPGLGDVVAFFPNAPGGGKIALVKHFPDRSDQRVVFSSRPEFEHYLTWQRKQSPELLSKLKAQRAAGKKKARARRRAR
ncbi:hypothetical protein HY546_00165 [archaeon]|nr:hypothetical protein [archaeon]